MYGGIRTERLNSLDPGIIFATIGSAYHSGVLFFQTISYSILSTNDSNLAEALLANTHITTASPIDNRK